MFWYERNSKALCLYKGAEVKSCKLWELLTVRPFFCDLSWNCLLKTHTSHIFNCWSHIIAEKLQKRCTGRTCCACRNAVDFIVIPWRKCQHKNLMDEGSGAGRCSYPEQQPWKNNTALLSPAPQEEMVVMKGRGNAPALPIACPGSQGGNLAKCPWGASCRSPLLPFLPGSSKSQASLLPCKRQGQRKLFAVHWVFQLLPYLQVKLWSVSQLYTYLQGFSCGKCRVSSSCCFIRVAHTGYSSFPKQQRFVRPYCIYMWEMTATGWGVQTSKEKAKEELLFLR